MDQYELIRIAHRFYKKGVSQITRETGHLRDTVRKALKGQAWKYKERISQPFPILGPYLKIVNNWLEKDKLAPKPEDFIKNNF